MRSAIRSLSTSTPSQSKITVALHPPNTHSNMRAGDQTHFRRVDIIYVAKREGRDRVERASRGFGTPLGGLYVG